MAVNPASVESHLKYAKKLQLPFPIVADSEGSVAGAYEALKENGKSIIRTVYIIAENGEIVFAQQGMPSTEQLLSALAGERA